MRDPEPRPKRPRPAPGSTIVVLPCERCGCDSARVVGDKDRRCQHCGHVEVQPRPASPWDRGGKV